MLWAISAQADSIVRRLLIDEIRRLLIAELSLQVAAQLLDFFPQFFNLRLLRQQHFVHLLDVPLLMHEGLLNGDQIILQCLRIEIGHWFLREFCVRVRRINQAMPIDYAKLFEHFCGLLGRRDSRWQFHDADISEVNFRTFGFQAEVAFSH